MGSAVLAQLTRLGPLSRPQEDQGSGAGRNREAAADQAAGQCQTGQREGAPARSFGRVRLAATPAHLVLDAARCPSGARYRTERCPQGNESDRRVLADRGAARRSSCQVVADSAWTRDSGQRLRLHLRLGLTRPHLGRPRAVPIRDGAGVSAQSPPPSSDAVGLGRARLNGSWAMADLALGARRRGRTNRHRPRARRAVPLFHRHHRADRRRTPPGGHRQGPRGARPGVLRLHRHLRELDTGTDRDCFRARVALVQDWRRFPYIDPDLPKRFLQSPWPGLEASRVFRDRHEAWSARSMRHWREFVETRP